MKICYFAHSANKSGASLSLVNVICEMKKRGVIPYVILPEHGKIEERLVANNIPYSVIAHYSTVIPQGQRLRAARIAKYIVKRIRNAAAERKICEKLAGMGFDLIHINGLSQTVGARVAKKLAIPYIWHAREFLEEDHHTEFFDKKRAYSLIASANRVIAISNAVRDKLEKMTGAGNVTVIYNGVSTQEYETAAEHSFLNETTKMLIAGRISPPKGQLCAVIATGILRSRGYSVQLTIAGDGFPEYEKIIKEYIAKNGLGDAVELIGFCDDMKGLRSTMDIGLLCSECEAFGRVTIETMLAGSLFIGTNTGGTPELVRDGETGFLYEFDNATELADRIEYAITHRDEMRGLIRAGREFALGFTIERNCESIYSIYRELVQE